MCIRDRDYTHKDEEGRVEKVPDSLITAFKTKNGRIVYDGAGILPDQKTEDVKYSNVLISLINKHHIFNFVNTYLLKHPELQVKDQDFKLSDADYNEFIAYMKDKDIITIEIENVNVEALKALQKEGKKVFPQPEVIEIIKDKGLQKMFYQRNDIPSPDFFLVENKEQIEKYRYFFPFFQKPVSYTHLCL